MLDCLVIGAGHCGLMCGYLLSQKGFSYVIADKQHRIGDVWRQRPHHLHLFTSRRFCSLGQFDMEGNPNGFPSTLEFADYLERFSAFNHLNVWLNAKVIRLSKQGQYFCAEFYDQSKIFARTVIDATGSNQLSILPVMSKGLSEEILQFNVGYWANLDQLFKSLEHKRIAVIGDGASGRQIAIHLKKISPTLDIALACGGEKKLLPLTIFGLDLFLWLQKIYPIAWLYCLMFKNKVDRTKWIPYAYRLSRIKKMGIRLTSRLVAADKQFLYFDDGSHLMIDGVIWAVGYKNQNDWLASSLLALQDEHLVKKGVFQVGRKWLSCVTNQLQLNITRDASHIVQQVERFLNV